MNTLTEMLIENIKVIKLTQPAVAEIIAMVFMSGRRNEVDWKAVSAAIKERWSPSARERVFTMAWKIAEEAYKAQQIEVLA